MDKPQSREAFEACLQTYWRNHPQAPKPDDEGLEFLKTAPTLSLKNK